MRKRKPWETGPVEPRRTRPPSSSTPGPRSWSRREGRLQNSPRRLGRGDRRLPTHDRRADARGSGRQHWICEHHVACPPGVGKTHLAISLAITAAESGRKIYFGSLTDLVDSLEEAKAAGRLDRGLKTLTYPALLVVDEIGYLPVTQSGAILFFQLVNRRYGRASTVLTSKQGLRGVGAASSATRSWPPRCWTGCCTAATSSTSGATATGCAATPSSQGRSIRAQTEDILNTLLPESRPHEGHQALRGLPRSGRSAPSAGQPAKCDIFNGPKCDIFNGH